MKFVSKNYFLALFDLQLFMFAGLTDIDGWIRWLAGVGGVVVTVYTIRKMRQDYELNKIVKKNLDLDRQIKEQELHRQIKLNKQMDK